MGYEMERPSVKELTALADELENEIKVGEPYHIKETATKIINYIKGY
ncbi:Uncharacterised protein [Campylobacter hyointestinalis subsp. hyointestinalis]|uniref:Uncharacterized protein n=1 Tax=Campylobacter hyointestinalis subsp. hyointestinalis TaxID=91352 RepID=A0A9W5AWN2_CAMHY|nr:hypothetical protein [Campylobacter hyointestinalis]CUU92505.1 Uncharacterised protein [Campylobacter hyointestinalis subsp. hyointestinalis]